jgi:two-component system sporulation sensor kinase A
LPANLLALETIEKVFRQFEFGKNPDFLYISKILGKTYDTRYCGVFFWDVNTDINDGKFFTKDENLNYKPFEKFTRENLKPLFVACKKELLNNRRFIFNNFDSLPGETAEILHKNNFKKLLIFPLRDITEEASGCLIFGFIKADRMLEDKLLKAGEISAEMISSHLFNEAALKHTETKYQNLIEHTNDIVYSVNQDGQIVYINPNVEHYGYNAQKMTGRIIYSYIHSADKDKLKQNINNTLREQNETFCEFRLRDANGNYIWFEQGSKVNKNEQGEIYGVSAFARDITERKIAEKALKDSEEKYRILVERANDGICIIVGEEVVYANPSMELLTGRKREQIIGKPFMPLFAPDQMVTVAKNYMLHMNGEEDPQIYQTALQHESGEIIDVEYTASLIDYEQEKASLVFLHDLRARRQSEETLIRSERLAAVGTLAGGIAHEFNNINVTILGFSQLLMEKTDLEEEVKDWANRIHNAAGRAGKITRNLLAFSRPDEFKNSKADINTVIEDVINLVIREFESDSIKIDFSREYLPEINMDENQIGQVILNMLINARHAMTGRPDKVINVRTYCDKEFIYLKISDNGCGISKENLKSIFSPFFTTKGEHSRIYNTQSDIKGTGLGLSISESIIAKHDGTINVKSHLNSGTTFTIKLPVRSGDDKEDRQDGERTAKAEVIILETDEELRDLVGMLIENMGCNVYSSDNIIDGIDKIKSGKIDLVIFESLMLDSVEKEFFSIIQNMPAGRKPEIIIIHKGANNLESNYDIFKSIKKPFELDDLCKTVYSALSSLKYE